MSWFSVADTQPIAEEITPISKAHAFGSVVPGKVEFISGEDLKAIKKAIGELTDKSSLFFMTKGAWSNIRLLEYILEVTGPAEVYFTTWAISEDAIRKFVSWKESGLITDLYAVMDAGLRNRKPAIYQQAIAAFPNLKISSCHAKVVVIRNDHFAFTLIGSANMTKNPRREVGLILSDQQLAEENIKWILEEVYDVA